MIRALPTGVEEKVSGQLSAATEAIVEIHCSSWNVEDDVVLDNGFGRLSLEIKAALLLDVPYFVNKIPFNKGISWKCAVRTVVIHSSSPTRNSVLP